MFGCFGIFREGLAIGVHVGDLGLLIGRLCADLKPMKRLLEVQGAIHVIRLHWKWKTEGAHLAEFVGSLLVSILGLALDSL